MSFLQIFLPAFSSFVAALILFGIGLWVDRSKQQKKQETLYLSILRSIYYDYDKNLNLLCQLHAYLFISQLPSFRLELSRKDVLVRSLIPVCLNYPLLDRISDGYFEIVHIQNKLDHLANSVGHSKWSSLLLGTHQLIHNDIRFIFEILRSITDEIRRRTHETEGIPDLPKDYLKQKFDKWQNDSDIVEIARRQGTDLSKRKKFYEEELRLTAEQSGSEQP